MSNIGHGHVFPRDDGVKARCGGPMLCPECARDLARKMQGDTEAGQAVARIVPFPADAAATRNLARAADTMIASFVWWLREARPSRDEAMLEAEGVAATLRQLATTETSPPTKGGSPHAA